MSTETTSIHPTNPGPTKGSFSVTLKFNATAVMLYRNIYIARSGKHKGISAQEFLCSFSIHKTEIPPEFHTQLRLATTGQPKRYEELIQRIHTRAIEPARRRQQERERLEQLDQMRGWVTFAQQQIQQATSCDYRDAHLSDAHIQQRVRELLHEAQRLLVPPPALATKTQAASDFNQPEHKLHALLETINHACKQIHDMVPLAGGHFGRGYEFAPETIAQVQQLWFNTSDAVAVLNQRQQFIRPSGWSQMRHKVMPSDTGETHQATPSSTEQELPSDMPASAGITSKEPS